MQKLWRKTVKLFLKYPILWLPYICAFVAKSCLQWLQKLVEKRIWDWPTTSYSVLGSAPFHVYDKAAHVRAIRLVSVLGWGAQYVYLGLDAIALVVTAFLVGMIVRGEQPNLRTAIAALRAYPRRILGYSLKYWLLALALTALIAEPAFHLAISLPHRSKAVSFALTDGDVLVMLLCSAWIMTPIAIRLLRPVDSGAISAADKRLGRYFVILASVVNIALGRLFFPPFLKILPHASGAGKTVAVDLFALVLSFPNLLAAIALSLLAASAVWQTATSQPVLDHKLLRLLMPLHFQQDKEP